MFCKSTHPKQNLGQYFLFRDYSIKRLLNWVISSIKLLLYTDHLSTFKTSYWQKSVWERWKRRANAALVTAPQACAGRAGLLYVFAPRFLWCLSGWNVSLRRAMLTLQEGPEVACESRMLRPLLQL